MQVDKEWLASIALKQIFIFVWSSSNMPSYKVLIFNSLSAIIILDCTVLIPGVCVYIEVTGNFSKPNDRPKANYSWRQAWLLHGLPDFKSGIKMVRLKQPPGIFSQRKRFVELDLEMDKVRG